MSTIRIELAGGGMPDQWIDVIDVGLKSQRQVSRWVELAQEAQGGDEAAATTLVTQFVVSWRILNPETGLEVAAPADASLGDVPLRALKLLFDNLQGQVDALQSKS